MTLDPGTRMFSGTEINAAMADSVGQSADDSTFTGTTTVEDLVSDSIANVGTVSTAAVVATGDVATATVTASGAMTAASLAASAAVTAASVTASAAVQGASVVATGYVRGSIGNALTAVGTDRATSLALTKQTNNITTAGSGTGVTLPTVASVGTGGMVFVFNAGANAIQVYGSGSDTIDTVAGSTGVPLTNAKRAVFVAVAAATWISAQLGVVSA